eukprot:8033335-Ditylum_brightwellii.AAC.1
MVVMVCNTVRVSLSITVTHYAVTALHIRVVMHYGEYLLPTQTFGKNNKTMSQKEATEEETGFCPAQLLKLSRDSIAITD